MATAVTATVLTGSVLGLGMASFSAPAQAASQSAAASETTNPRAAEILNELYNTAFKGEMPQDIEGLKVNKSTQSDVYNKIGEPEKKRMPATHSIYTAQIWGIPDMDFRITKTIRFHKSATSEPGWKDSKTSAESRRLC